MFAYTAIFMHWDFGSRCPKVQHSRIALGAKAPIARNTLGLTAQSPRQRERFDTKASLLLLERRHDHPNIRNSQARQSGPLRDPNASVPGSLASGQPCQVDPLERPSRPLRAPSTLRPQDPLLCLLRPPDKLAGYPRREVTYCLLRPPWLTYR